VWVNSAAEVDKLIAELNTRLKDLAQDETKLRQLLARMETLQAGNKLPPELLPKVEAAQNSLDAVLADFESSQNELFKARSEQLRLQTEAFNSYIACKGTIHEGVTLRFGPLQVSIERDTVNQRVSLLDGKIVFGVNH
ncbi:MAG: hypothetical protein LBT12_05190, partial [Oscillospiraceae bacterium]|jgi:uncharacterized protein (DUF342 family)|nr:hypothetical protein [Oscillospiraceae bacterium]